MRLYIQIVCLCLPVFMFGQSEQLMIGTNPITPSAIAQFDAVNRGVLTSQMSSINRMAIANPAEGLLVYDLDVNSFWYYDGAQWVELNASYVCTMQDGDNDTKIWAEKNPNEDILRFDVAGQELMILDESELKFDSSLDLLMGGSMSGAGQKMFYDSSREALRMGEVDGVQWNEYLLGQSSIAFGENTTATGVFSAAWGEDNVASGNYATAFGKNTDATGAYATSWGSGSQATGSHSVAFGSNGDATNNNSSCFGVENESLGVGSTAFGFLTSASADYSTTFGSITEANGDQSTVMGLSSKAEGNNSTAIGQGVIAESFAEASFGRFNTNYTPISKTSFEDDDRLFVIGNGSSNSNRKDAFLILKNGTTTGTGSIINVPRPLLNESNVKFIKLNNGFDVGFAFKHTIGPSDLLSIQRINGGVTTLMTWNNGGDIGIGLIPTISNKLAVAGEASKSTTGAWLGNSDSRLKKEIETINETYALSQILKMQGVHYEWNDPREGMERPTNLQDGFLAQNIQDVWPLKVSEDTDGFLMTAYGDYDPMFVEAFKAQQELISALQERQNSLEQNLKSDVLKIEELKNKIAKLNNRATVLLQEIAENKPSADTTPISTLNNTNTQND